MSIPEPSSRKSLEHEHDDTLVWKVCPYLRQDFAECRRCPSWGPFEHEGDLCKRGCRALAEELINIVQTGNPWRKLERDGSGTQP